MSSTHLIYVSKDKAEVFNDLDGSFLNKVDEGIIIPVGAEISIEGIAIQSLGVGSDIIEIPNKIQNYNYLTNRMVLNTMCYINHNYEFTCLLPLTVMTGVYTTITDDNYGYLNAANLLPAVADIPVNTRSKNLNSTVGGKKFYLGSYTRPNAQGVYNAFTPIAASPTDPIANSVPTKQIFSFCESNIEFGVDIGYDNPSNIANKITQDFHSAEISSQTSKLTFGGVVSQSLPNINSDAGVININSQLACSSYNSSTILTYGIPQMAKSLTGYTYYDGILGTMNPFYNYYGSRLGAVGVNGLGTTKANTFLTAATPLPVNPPHTNDIYCLDQPPLNAADPTKSEYFNYYVMVLNLEFETNNLNILKGFIDSQKVLEDDNLTAYTTKQLDSDLLNKKWYWNVDIGRYDDGQATNATYLLSPALPAGGTAMKHTAPAYAKFDEEVVSKAYISPALISQGCFIDDEMTITPTAGVKFTAKQYAKKLNLSVVAVNTGTLGNNEVCIGIVMQTKIMNAIVQKGQYTVVDLSFYNPANPQVILMNPTLNPSSSAAPPPATYNDIGKFINVGSPNMQMTFDATRGRFGFENFAWANMLNNENVILTEPNPAAGDEVITANKFGIVFPAIKFVNNGAQPKVAYTQYAQSGIGIRNISVIKGDGTYEEIDYNDANDIKNKWSGSLLERLGFEYNALLNKNGIPDALFSQRTYNSVIPRTNPRFFPYPLTTNLRFDTSLSIGLSQRWFATGSLPNFNLNLENSISNINISSETDTAYATNLPQKLVFPYWLVKSDIIEGVEFSSENGGKRENIMAVCNRAYISGDFAISFSTSYAFKATKEFVLTGIKTAILNPDLSPADIDPKTSIIYKVVKPIPYFQEQQEAAQAQQKK